MLAAPDLDVRWEHHPAHFWLVVLAAATTAALAYATGDAAGRRRDPRLQLISLAFFLSSGFLALHALATPGVLLDNPNLGFQIAVPVGLLLAAPLAAGSSLPVVEVGGVAIVRSAPRLRTALLVLMVAWGVASVAGLGPLADDTDVERASGPIAVPAVIGALLYLFAARRYAQIGRGRSSPLPLAVAAGMVLLAEALLATAFARNWHATWWEWHLLIVAAFGLVAFTARREWRQERFSSLYTEATAAGRREVSIIFADLAGFTSFSEGRDPREVSEMLNAHFEVAVPAVVSEHGGEVDRLIGDAVMATFNTRGDQPDHAERAARAALAIRDRSEALSREHPGWPRFRIGVNTGEALVGVLGAAGGRDYTVIGDTVNAASRIEGIAEAGQVVVGEQTMRRLSSARVEPLGEVEVKGRAQPIAAYRLTGL